MPDKPMRYVPTAEISALILACLLLTGCYTTQRTVEEQPLEAEEESLQAEEQALEANAPVVGYKDPGTAQLIGVLITGGGQFYVGKPEKGAVLLATGVTAPLIGLWLSEPCDQWGCDNPDFTPLYAGLGVSTFAWIYGIAWAGRDAREINRERGFSFSAAPAVVPDGKAVRPGLALSLEW